MFAAKIRSDRKGTKGAADTCAPAFRAGLSMLDSVVSVVWECSSFHKLFSLKLALFMSFSLSPISENYNE